MSRFSRKQISELLYIQDCDGDKCVGKFDRNDPKPRYAKYFINDYELLLCLIKGVKPICELQLFDKNDIPKKNIIFLNKIINLANESKIRCIIYNHPDEIYKIIYAFRPNNFIDAMILLFFDIITDEKKIFKKFFGNTQSEYIHGYKYRIDNPYNYGKTLGYLDKYIINYYLYNYIKYGGFPEKDARKIFDRDRKMYSIIIGKIKKDPEFKKMCRKYSKKITKIPLFGKFENHH